MDRRAAIVQIDSTVLQLVLGGHPMRALVSDWPADARITDARWEFGKQVLLLCVESATFDPVPEGNILPDWTPTFTETRLAPELVALIEHFRKETDAAT